MGVACKIAAQELFFSPAGDFFIHVVKGNDIPFPVPHHDANGRLFKKRTEKFFPFFEPFAHARDGVFSSRSACVSSFLFRTRKIMKKAPDSSEIATSI